MSHYCRSLLALLFVCMLVGFAGAQERGLGGAAATDDPPPPGVDKLFWELTKSKDRSTKAVAERYVSLVRTQEWSDLSGKFKTVARYVKHDPNLTSVTIETTHDKKQKTVPVDKLSKVCQSRVRQIDAAQRKLKEWAAAHPDEVAGAAALGEGALPQDVGAPMQDEVGTNPAPDAAAIGQERGAPPAAPDPSAFEPDPLGFAEIPLPPGADGTPPQPAPAPESPPETPPSTGTSAAPIGPTQPWQTDYEAFRKMFKVYPVGLGQPEPPTDRKLLFVFNGSPTQHEDEWNIDFGDLQDLRLVAEAKGLLLGMGTPGLSRNDILQKMKGAEEAEKRIGEVAWEATFKRFNGPNQPLELELPPLPEPLRFYCKLDVESGAEAEDWQSLARGDRIRIKARLSMANPSLVALMVREPEKVAASAVSQR